MGTVSDNLYFIMTIPELRKWANLMSVQYIDIPIDALFKKTLYLRIKEHIKELQNETTITR